ncbi:hypothetical protein H6P81_012083 [Aristolochia fimbriata]|uniref:Uncharacterized protein n=1 Tax=Aristolochia fimbriata TaxID=158543 RepID=A0AAV7EAT3_ARIFI|nr:hypothetical protein H6P81_012083 [Aristolochia fimbriata]
MMAIISASNRTKASGSDGKPTKSGKGSDFKLRLKQTLSLSSLLLPARVFRIQKRRAADHPTLNGSNLWPPVENI